MPERIQQRRTKGWRKPENTASVARPSRFGNPFVVGRTSTIIDSTGVIVAFADRFNVFVTDRAHAVELFRGAVTGRIRVVSIRRVVPQMHDIRRSLRGMNLMCFCPLDQPCHADVLLEIANRDA